MCNIVGGVYFWGVYYAPSAFDYAPLMGAFGAYKEKNRARIDLVKFLFFESAFCAVLPYFEKTETIENSEIRPRNYM